MELSVEHLSVSLSNQQILHDISLKAESGEFIGIIGPNGSGKTTFLKALRGLYPFTDGSVILMVLRYPIKVINKLPDKLLTCNRV